MTTIYDVAQKANVSRMTVSRVINNYEFVNEDTRKRVLETISELNYRPNMMAKGLATRQSRAIAFVMGRISNPFHPAVVQGVEDACYEKGYILIICNANEKAKEQEYIDNLKDRCVDGVIFHQLRITDNQLNEINELGMKSVLIDNKYKIEDAINVINDNVMGAYIATKHLIELGHKEIGIIHGNLNLESKKHYNIWSLRMKGFKKALREAGLEVNPEFVVHGGGTKIDNKYSGNVVLKDMYGGKEAMKKIIQMENKPTAIYASCDLMAIGAINGAMENQFVVPDQISIIGQDGLELGEVLYPQLTTLAQPRYEMGYKAACILIEAIDIQKKVESLVLKPELIIRDSTRALLR